MKFNVSSRALYGFLASVNKVINSKNALTILNNFLLTLRGDLLTITACDLENSLVGRIHVTEAEGEGKFCIDARRLVELLKEMPEQGINFDINDDNLAIRISYQTGHYNLIGINGDEYPFNPDDAGKVEPADEEVAIRFRATGVQLLNAIDNTIFAVGTDDLRPQMMGILWDIHEDDVTFVATDTRKMVKFVDTNIKPGAVSRFILPVKPATVLKNVFSRDSEIEVLCTPQNVTFSNTDFIFTCSLIKGNFPDYNRVIPTTSAYTVMIDRQLLANAVKRISVFVGDNGLVKFKFTPEKVVMRAIDLGLCADAREELPCDFSGEQIIMGFSATYLQEMLGTFSCPEVKILLSDPSRPGVFLPAEDEEGTELVMLLMPMTVTEFED